MFAISQLMWTLKTEAFWAQLETCEKRPLAASRVSVCPSVLLFICMEQVGCHWTEFGEIWYLGIFKKSVDIVQESLQPDNSSDPPHEDRCAFLLIHVSRWAEFQTETVEKIEIRSSFSIPFFLISSRCVIVWKNVTGRDRPRLTIRACLWHAGYLRLWTHTQNK